MKIRRYYRVGFEKGVTNGHPRGLVVAEQLDDGSIALGFALCSHNDVFDSERANLIAEGRLKSRKFVIKSINDLWLAVDDVFIEMDEIFRWCITEVIERPRAKAAQ